MRAGVSPVKSSKTFILNSERCPYSHWGAICVTFVFDLFALIGIC